MGGSGSVLLGDVGGAGEIAGQTNGGRGVAEGQTGPAHLDLAVDVGLHALGAERVGQLEMEAAIAAVVVISCGEAGSGKDIGMLPLPRAVDLRDLIAALVHQIPRR